jgi:capsular polysaccharide transport system permease protein
VSESGQRTPQGEPPAREEPAQPAAERPAPAEESRSANAAALLATEAVEPASGGLASASEPQAIVATAQNEPLAIEVELQPLPIRPQLPTSFDWKGSEPKVRAWRRLFVATVAVPMVIGTVFLLFIIAPRYSSTASFVVRSTDEEGPGAGLSNALSSMASGARSSSTIASDETYEVNAYLTSRDIVDLLARSDNLRAILSRPEGDFVFRFPTFWLPDNNEFLYRRFQWMATADVDPSTSISTIEVNAFTPEDAQSLARALLGYAEALVNRINERLYQGQLATAERFMANARNDVDSVEARLEAFRDASGSVDPMVVAQSKLKVIEALSQQLAQAEATIAQQLTLSPTSPQIAALRAQAKSYSEEIQKRELEIAGAAGSEAAKLQTYDQLTLQRDLAAKALADAVAQRDQARHDAERQHLYVQLISQPNLSLDWARYPQATWDLLALLTLSLLVFYVLLKLRDFTAEHQP